MHFDPDDFERDLRNEMLGLPLRKILKPGAAPRAPDPILDIIDDFTRTEAEGKNAEHEDEEEEEDVEVSQIQPVNSVHKQMISQISREVDILAEIAELQMKLVKKIGNKKANLESFADVLSDPNNSFQVSKDTVVRSIKDEIYKKKPEKQNDGLNTLNANDVHLILDTEQQNSVAFKDFKGDLQAKLGLGNVDPIVIFDLNSHHEFQKRVRKIRTEVEELEQMAPDLKKNNKVRVKRVREKMIEEGEKNVEKKKADIEMYKLKIVELRLWKKKWQAKVRNNGLKKRKRKEKMDKRRAWIKEQIEKGYMHKSCTILIHSRAKFPYESGFEPSKKPRGLTKKFAATPDNLCPFIKGVHLGKNGLVYPVKKRLEKPSTSTFPPPPSAPKLPKPKRKIEVEPKEPIENSDEVEEQSPMNLPAPIVEPIFTLINPQDILQQNRNQEIHYIQEPILAENLVLDDNGGAVIHYVQFDPNQPIL